MASNYTEHFGLNQWAAEDHVLREEFNADNAKIDAALYARPRMAMGSYVGTGTYGENNPTTLNFDFEPKLVVIRKSIRNASRSGAIFVSGQSSSPGPEYFDDTTDAGYLTVWWDKNTVCWFTNSTTSDMADRQMNKKDATYYYVALGV